MTQTQPSTLPEHELAPKIRLAGQDWPIPELAPKQLRKVIPLTMRVMPTIAAIAMDLSKKRDVTNAMSLLDENGMDDIFQIVYLGLTRAHPKLTYAEFEEWSMSTFEAMMAIPIIVEQSGVMQKSSVDPRELISGEASAGNSASQIGTA